MGLFSSITSIIGGSKQKKASKKAVAAQAAATKEAMGYINTGLGKAETDFQPYRDAGQFGLGQYQSAVTGQGFDDFIKSPGYEFRFNEGNRAVENSGAARGLLQSGGTLKALMRQGQGYASDEFGKYTSNLRDLTNLGYSGTRDLNNTRASAYDSLGTLITGLGNAQAKGYTDRGQISANQWGSVGKIGDSIASIFSGGF